MVERCQCGKIITDENICPLPRGQRCNGPDEVVEPRITMCKETLEAMMAKATKTAVKPATAPPAKSKVTGGVVPGINVIEKTKPLAWVNVDKGEWRAPTPDPRGLGARIKELRGYGSGEGAVRTMFAVYIDGIYFGSSEDLDKAKQRAERREMSRSALSDTIEQGTPAFLALSPAERKAARDADSARRTTAAPAPKGKAPAAAAATPAPAPKGKAPAATAPPAAAPAAAPAPANGGRKSRSAFANTDVITLMDRRNPRRAGTVQWERYEVIIKFDGATVKEFLAGGGNGQALAYAVETNHAKVGPAT